MIRQASSRANLADFGDGLLCRCILCPPLLSSPLLHIRQVMEFLSYHPQALVFNIITAITSATGQLFIFYTIKQFGPVVFTIIMTTRQVLLILFMYSSSS